MGSVIYSSYLELFNNVSIFENQHTIGSEMQQNQEKDVEQNQAKDVEQKITKTAHENTIENMLNAKHHAERSSNAYGTLLQIHARNVSFGNTS